MWHRLWIFRVHAFFISNIFIDLLYKYPYQRKKLHWEYKLHILLLRLRLYTFSISFFGQTELSSRNYNIHPQASLPQTLTFDILRDLVPFVQFKKRERQPRRSVSFGVKLPSEACNFTESSILPWVFFMFFRLYKRYQIV